MTVGRSRLYPCSSGPPAPRNGSKPLRKAKSAPRSGERIPRHPVWSQKARPDVQTSIRPGLKSSCSVIRIDAARYYSASLRLQQIFDAAAKRAGQSEHGGDGSFAKVFAALLVHLDGAQGNAGAAGQPGCVCSIESGPCERVDVFHVSGRFWSTSACGEKRTPARPAWTSFPS